MSTETKKSDRVNISITRETHLAISHIAKLLEKDLQTVAEESAREWIEKHRPMARKRSNQLLAA